MTNGQRLSRRPGSSPGGTTLTVCIVNWNTRGHLERCLEALPAACAGLEAEFVVVDNASTDGSQQMVRERFPAVRVIALDRNVGFAAGNNLGIEASRADYVLLLNPDIYAPAGSVRALVEFAAAQPQPVAVGATLVGHDGVVQTPMYRRFPSRAQILLYHTVLRFAARRIPRVGHRYLDVDVGGPAIGPVAVDQLPGACCLVPRSILQGVGLMDPGYFVWYEDVDWCYRIRQAGHTLLALPQVRMLHAGGASFQSWSQARQLRQSTLALFRFMAKFRRDDLLFWVATVLRADLLLEATIVRIVERISPRAVSAMPGWKMLLDLRREIGGVVEAYRAGSIVELSAEGPELVPAAEAAPRPETAAHGR